MEQEIQPQPQQPINPIPLPVRKINKKAIVIIVLAIIAIAIGYYGYRTFTIHREKLGEVSFYKDANMELKVVLIHENIPLSYVGNSYSVACQSQNTKAPDLNDEAEWKFDLIEKGWNRTPSAYLGNGLGSNKNIVLNSLVDEAKKLYLVKDKATLVILASPNVYISFDGCRTFSNWVLKDNLLANIIVESTPEFEKCVAENKQYQITRDCSDVKLSGKGQPIFQDVVANDNGHASFKITSSAFKDSQMISVESNDFGKTWKSTVGTFGLVNNFGIVSFVKDKTSSWPLEWHITLSPEDTKNNEFQIISQLENPPAVNAINFDERLLGDVLVDKREIQPKVGDPVDIKFRLANDSRINPSGPKGWQYLEMSAGFSRLGGFKKDGTTQNPVLPYGTSFPVEMFGNKVLDRSFTETGNFVGSKIFIATVKTSDEKNSYTYEIFLEKLPIK